MTPDELAKKRHRVISAWNSGDLKRAEIAREFRVDQRQVKAWIEEALATGETKRPLDDKQLKIPRDPARDANWGWRG